ncbi:hypothetical protein ACO9S2_00300 [Nitrospira sp. NS4]|uniref:hypothetical protein n=1 Tax=Nitrospira sp. NS4 TaxID=3414498 RepID=UPI003C307374
MWTRQQRNVILGGLILGLIGCTPGPSARNVRPAGHSQAEVERDYMECEYKARLANQEQFYSRSSPFPFGPGPQSPADHARALHGLSTINAMRDTCLAAKGYRVE